MTSLVWQENCTVGTNDIDCFGRAAPAAVGRYLQEAAIHHARHLRVAFDDLAPKGLTWILMQLDLRSSHWPAVDDRLAIATWPSKTDPLFAYRQFVVRNASGQECIRAATAWALLNLRTRRPVRMPAFIREIQTPDRPDAVENAFPRLRAPQEAAGPPVSIPVLRADLDLNRHVNNTRYLTWLIETVPDETWETGELSELQLQYRAEARRGEEVLATAGTEENTTDSGALRHALRRRSDRRLLALARTVWRHRPSPGPFHAAG
ncbi:MAG: hypothetical protein GXP31_11380 [Kiritimatiellaeota bacterium]|nr:hypothetical protein [Kiritimatiellota bacterium]